MAGFALLLRWSARDLRRRWPQVVALALVTALGVGTWSSLGGSSRWRRVSNDRSFALLAVHDLRVSLADGSYAAEGTLRSALGSLVSTGEIGALEERLVVNTQVDASTADRTVLAAGQLVGVDVTAGGPQVNRFHVRAGTTLAPGTAVLDYHFAEVRDLPPTGTIRLSGGVQVPYVGQVLTPDHFVVISNRGGFFAGNWFAVVYASLEVAQAVSRHEGQVNELVLIAGDGVDLEALRTRIADRLAAALPGTGVTVRPFTDEPVYRMLYEDIKSDQRFYNVFAGLILAGALFGAFNLARRMMESERREIGISMALGVPVRSLVLRPLLVGVQIALLGAVSGVGVGLVIGAALRSLFQRFLPLPVWDTAINWPSYASGAALGAAVPLVGLAWPLAKAVRVTPLETMQPPYRLRSRRIPRVGRRLVMPGSSLVRIPFRNVLRSLQRTVLTVLAVGATSAVFFSVLGMMDSFRATIRKGELSAVATAPGRLTVDLDAVMPVDSAPVRAVAASAAVASVDVGLRIPAMLLRADGSDAFGVLLELRDLAGGMWRPRTEPTLSGNEGPGVVLAQKAAGDLGVRVGDRVTIRHPVRTGAASFDYATTSLAVLAIHDVPLRTEVLVDLAHAGLLNLTGLVNLMDVMPGEGVSSDGVKRALFPIIGVASVQGVTETVEVYRDLMDSMMGFLGIVEGATVLLVLLVAFNATSINADERRREHATMLAFGMPVHAVLRTMVVENLVLGLLGAAVGIGLGEGLVQWLMKVSVPETMPDISVTLAVTANSVLLAFGASIAAVIVAPLFTLRQLLRTDVPSTLRVVE